MKNSLQLGIIGGIKVTVHWTFVLLIGWIVFINLRVGSTAENTLWSVLFVLLIFGCVVLHEFGHAFAAKRFGIKTRSITLLPIGGLASLESMPEKPKQELIVAIAGPVVNLLIAAILIPFVNPSDVFTVDSIVAVHSGNLLPNLFSVNIVLAVFNMLPAFPMDGGRVLRALLGFKFKRHIATRIAASIGQAISVGFILLGLFYNPFLVFIGIFIFLGAQAEAGSTRTQFMMANFTVRDAMIRDFHTLDYNDPISSAVQLLLNGQEKNFLVMQNEKPAGTLDRNQIIKALSEKGKDSKIEDAMHKSALSFQQNTPLKEAWPRMQMNRQIIAPIYDGSKLIGALDNENILEFVMIREATEKSNVRQLVVPPDDSDKVKILYK
ncbi:site-2 protease family protein [Flammeovirgaceae bacterium]